MTASDLRLPAHPSQLIDRSRPITFRFNGRSIPGYQGDTLASALYAAGITIFGRSFKYHRPRGLLCVSGQCPNCMMNVDGAPNVRTCARPATEGTAVRHQNAWPSLEHDAISILDRLDRLMPVGFYYKSLISPRILWRVGEKVIRRIAGLGSVDAGAVPAGEFEHVNSFTDVAVVGGGLAGCHAAIEAAQYGLRVTLIDDQSSLGGQLRSQTRPPFGDGEHVGLPGYEVARRLDEAVQSLSGITVLTDAAAFGLYEDNLLAIHHGRELTKLRSRRIVVATGAIEVPMVFTNNDLPGIMLSSGALRLVNLYGVRPGHRGVVVTNNDQGLSAALELADAGIEIAAVADSRPSADNGSGLTELLRGKGIPVLAPYAIRRAAGTKRVAAAVLGRFENGAFTGDQRRVRCDFVCMAPGFDPQTALLSQGDCELAYDDALGETAPSAVPPGIYVAGDVTALHDPELAVLQGRLAGLEAAAGLTQTSAVDGADRMADLRAQVKESERVYRAGLSPRNGLIVPDRSRKKFVCVCEDVTEKDLHDAIHEGFDDIQTLKRYSTLSMGPCQGKMCLKACVDICAAETGRTVDETGSTTPRPPLRPVPMGALAGPRHLPFRHTSLHHKHEDAGGAIVEVGEWKRAHSYGSPMDEVRAVRERVGIIDVSTLGKLDVRGSDAPMLMDKVYTHYFSNLRVGRTRYGMICSDNGIILDDGIVTRLAEDRYYVTTGTGNIDLVEEWFRWWAVGTGMCVHITNLTPGLAAINVAGPRARDTLRKLTDVDLSPRAFRYMRTASGAVAGVPSLLVRIGFVGETAWEIHFPAEYGEHVWDALLEAGEEFGISLFGVEAQRILRLEKKHIIPGQDTDVVSNAIEADMAWAVQFEREDFIGRSALMAVQERGLRDKLVGFVMENGAVPEDGVPVLLNGSPVGKVTSSRYSPTLRRGFGLAWVPIDLAEDGTRIQIRVDGRPAPARVAIQPVYDPEGRRLRE